MDQIDASNTRVGLFGPWSPTVDPPERGKQFRALAALSAAFLGANHEIVSTLRHAENDDAAAARALELLDATPTLTRRRLLSVFGSVTWPRPKRTP
jgi:hypothetical protein